jgi:AcrR family transcriptional regulator
MPEKPEKRVELLDAGLLLLMEHPPDQISMDDVAAKAGVTKPMVYYYFGSKRGYYKQLVRYVQNSMEELLADIISPEISFRDLLQRIVMSRIEQLINHPEISNAVRIMVSSKTIGGASSRSRIATVFTRLQPVFDLAVSSGEIREDTELHLVMGLVNSLLDGVVRMHDREFYSSVKPSVFTDMLIRLVFDGIGTGKRS